MSVSETNDPVQYELKEAQASKDDISDVESNKP